MHVVRTPMLAGGVALAVLLSACTVKQAPANSPPPGPAPATPPGAAPAPQPGAAPAPPAPGGWVEYRAKRYGFSMLVPPGTRVVDRQPWKGWGQVFARNGPATLHGLAKLGVQAPPKAIEDAGVRYTGIPRQHWKGLNQGKHTGGQHWYRTAYASNGRDAVLAYYGTGPRGSYLLMLKTTVADYRRNKPAYHRWYRSVRVW